MWRITVEDLDMVIATKTSEEGAPEPREVFAQQVAVALGWSFDPPVSTGLAEAA